MITFSYEEITDIIEKLDNTAHLIYSGEDIATGEALDNIFEIKASLSANLRGFEDMLDAMSDEYN